MNQPSPIRHAACGEIGCWWLCSSGVALLEGITREELVWRPLSVPIHLLPIVMMLWRRTHPLLSVAVAWSVITGLDIAAIAADAIHPVWSPWWA